MKGEFRSKNWSFWWKKNFFLQIDLFHFKISQTIHLNTRHIDIWFEILPLTRDLKKQIELELEFKQKAI